MLKSTANFVISAISKNAIRVLSTSAVPKAWWQFPWLARFTRSSHVYLGYRFNPYPSYGTNDAWLCSGANGVLREQKIKVGAVDINFLKVGNGTQNVLCLPGALGTIWTDFKPQVEGFNREQFTLVAWDPPGYGKSRPPEKDFDLDFYEKDADAAYELMKALKIPKYSLLGWSDGGITGMIHAAKYPTCTSKLVIWGANSFILPHEIEVYKKIRDINSWSKRMREPMIAVYGEALFAEYWSKWTDGMEKIFKEKNGNICSDLIKYIKCPTFILHGQKDPMVDNVHISHLHTHIDGARIHLYPDGKHNIHINYAEDFNKRVQEFLLLP